MTTPPPDIPLLRGPVPLAHLLLRQFVRPGAAAVDATCGNGNDTLLLAGLVGPMGRVWAFDIQVEAVEQTARRLAEAGFGDRVRCIHGGHETLERQVPAEIDAVVFNLGYLPGGDRSIVTRPDTTLEACRQAANLLRPGGILAITVYPGHDGGECERTAVEAWASGCDPRGFHTWRMGQMNVPGTAPYFIMIQKVL